MTDETPQTGERESETTVRESAADGRYTAVVDRFERTDPESDGRELAVLLLESGDEVVAERAIPAWRLSEAARRRDAVLTVRLRNGAVVSVAFDPEATERRGERAQSRFDRLAERPDDSGDSDDAA